MAATFAAELETHLSAEHVQGASFQTLRQHTEAALPVAMKGIHTAAAGPIASPIEIGSGAGSAEFAGSIVLTGWLLWQAWKRRVI